MDSEDKPGQHGGQELGFGFFYSFTCFITSNSHNLSEPQLPHL